MIYFGKWIKLPGPKELGMSDNNNAMPSELFRNNKTEYTWEQYYRYLKKTYPVKFFFASTVPEFFVDNWRDLSRPFKNAHYWFVSHTIPSRKYHMLDLRQPKTGTTNIDCYRYGWRDTDSRMVYAMFNLLVQFVEEEVPHGYYVPSEDAVAKDANLRYQLDNYKEFMSIYNWWKADRFVEDKEYQDKLTEWSDARLKFLVNTDPLWAELNTLEARNDAKLDEMLIRLIRIRGCLWT